MIKSEVYSLGRSPEHSAPVKLRIDISYFSLTHRRLQCKHQCVPRLPMDFMTFAFCFVPPASLNRGKSCTSISPLPKARGEVFTNQRGWSCQNWGQRWLCHSAEGTCYSSGQSPDHGVFSFTAVMLNILNDWVFAKSEHIHKPRDHLRTKPIQEKACFYFGTAAWRKRVQIPGVSQLESVYGGGLKHRLS